MSSEDGRPQDQDRRHRRGGSPSPETSSLLARHQAAMRDELRTVLDDIRGELPDPGLGLDPDAPVKRPSLNDRIRMWDLAIKLARELGTEVDETPAPGQTVPSQTARRRRRIDFG